jgi:hypothetical protein
VAYFRIETLARPRLLERDFFNLLTKTPHYLITSILKIISQYILPDKNAFSIKERTL